MNRFVYKASDENLNIIKGYIEEQSLESAMEQLRSRGLKIIYVKKSVSIYNLKIGRQTLKYEEIAGFCGQVAVIINTGVSIIKGLEIIANQDKKLKKPCEEVLIGLRKGETFANSMKASGIFPQLLIDMVYSGEISGNLDEVLFNMEGFYRREGEVKSKIKGAAIYPAVLFVLTISMMFFFNFFILSKLKQIFEDVDNLPFITRFVLGAMNFINNNSLFLAVTLLLFIIIIKYILDIPKVTMYIDRISLSIPILGELKRNVVINRFSRSMGIFIKSAVPIINALENIEDVIENKYIGFKIGNAKREIINGISIGEALEEQGLFDTLTIQMIKIGEETGKLEEMFFKLTDIYDKKVETNINRMMTLVEPVFTLIIGLFVGIIIIAIAMPILQMSNGIN
ncbi:type II secretion system F family protein [Clostridium sp. MSJ-11]|uniref:Type II secretion system F family protein n=1 Tax=Clostridium mobile TaxID=2841512 RepID=A0ABS6EJG2_9CLOT|nr:type II secretion system F family protein [Clostridium mobile]MBU5485344.1 type II secretion system F family protein [Clostridium mobile]